MSDKNDDKKNENDPYDFFKLQLDNDDNDFDPKNNKPKKGFPFFGILLTVAAVLFVFNLLFSTGSNELIDFSEFRNLVEQGQIVRVELGDRYFTGYTADANANIEQQKKIGFLRPLNNPQPAGIYRTSGVLMQSFIQLLDEKGVEYKFIERQNNVLLQILVNIAVPVLLIFLVYFFIFKKMGGGMSGSMFGIGGGRSKAIDEGKVKTRFSDVAGVDEAKDELVEVVDFLKEPKKYTEIGGKIPKG
ncbi:MAG: ATP-dependent metallopeptidase FtsH/Yme1/Tma family protein, partial [Treponema sp.]|nr:ATP-dependent metallopeptidase FtsH/Yme1/Tma family protein [Treponema sp.]